MPAARAALLDFQRAFAVQPPPVAGRPAAGAVLDGRDVGTVVCPDADVKLFVTASVEVRAERRVKELQARGQAAIYDAVLEDLKQRDARDSQRAVAPLKPADDAFLLDTSALDADQALAAALSIIRSALSRATPPILMDPRAADRPFRRSLLQGSGPRIPRRPDNNRRFR